MHVELSPGVFQAPDALTDLLNLHRCFAEGRHDWVASPAVLSAAREYLTQHAPHFAEAFAELAVKGTVAAVAWTGSGDMPDSVQIEAADLTEHAADLCRPAVLVVEDQDSDGCFIHALAEVFQADRVRRALSAG